MLVGGFGAWRSLASALDWGSRGRRFKSCRPDLPCITVRSRMVGEVFDDRPVRVARRPATCDSIRSICPSDWKGLFCCRWSVLPRRGVSLGGHRSSCRDDLPPFNSTTSRERIWGWMGASPKDPPDSSRSVGGQKPNLESGVIHGGRSQQPSRPEIATTGESLPSLIVGKQTIIRTRRPESWRSLDAEDAVILEVLRQRGLASECSLDETARRLLAAVNKPGRFVGLCRVAASEPPRVRAMLGARHAGGNRAAAEAVAAGAHAAAEYPEPVVEI